MAVFVDDMFVAFGRMRMSHLIADSEDELLAMVDTIGVQQKWRQGTPGYDDHFDIAMKKRELAIAAGAIPIPYRTLALMIACRKRTGKLPKPEEAESLFKRLINQQSKVKRNAASKTRD
jgi:hypothetical protein